MPSRTITLSQFILQQERLHPQASGEFTSVLNDLALAAKMINREVTRAGLVDVLGYTGTENVHGEKVQKLDRFAHEVIYRVLGSTGQAGATVFKAAEYGIKVQREARDNVLGVLMNDAGEILPHYYGYHDAYGYTSEVAGGES